MKRLKNSTKAIIISICVAVFAVAGVLAAVLLGRDKDKGGSNPPVTPPSPSAPAVVYSLTEEQKALGLQVNDEYKKYESSKKKFFYDVAETQFSATGLTLNDIVSFDGKYLVGQSSDVYSVFLYENNAFVSLASKLASSSLLLNTDVSTTNILKVSGEFVVMSQTYTDQSTNYVDYHIVHLGETLSVPKAYHTTLKDVGGVNYNYIGEEMFGFFPKNDYFIAVYVDSTSTYQSFYLFEYVTDYTSYESFSRENVAIADMNRFDLGSDPMVLDYKDDGVDDLYIYYSKANGFYTDEPTPSYDTVTNYASVTLYEKGEYGSSKPNAIHIETENNGYLISYTYEIKIGENEKIDFELDETYSKIKLLFATEDYFGVLVQKTDENKKLLSGGKYIYFDYEMNIVADYVGETNNAVLTFSAGNKYFTTEGVFATEGNEGKVSLTKVFDFVENNYTFDSINDNFNRVILKTATSNVFFDVETLEVGTTNYDKFVKLDNKYYFLGNDDGNFVLDESVAGNSPVPVDVADVTFSNLNLLEDFSLYFLNNTNGGVDLYFGKTKLYDNVNNIETASESVKFSVGADYRVLCLEYIISQSSSEDSSGLGGGEVNNFAYKNDSTEIDNYSVQSSAVMQLTEETSVENHASRTYTYRFSDGYYPIQYTVFTFEIHRNNTVGECLSIPFKISVSNGSVGKSLYGCNYYSTVSKSGALWWTSSYYDVINVQGADSGNYDYREYWEWGPWGCFNGYDYYHNNNVSYSASVGSDKNGIWITFNVSDNGSRGNTISWVSMNWWTGPKSDYDNHSETYSSRLYYTVESRYINALNSPANEYVDMLDDDSTNGGGKYGSYYYDTNKYYLDKSSSYIKVSSWARSTVGYAASTVLGGKFVGITKPNTQYGTKYLYSTATRTYSVSIIKGSIQSNNTDRYKYVSIGNNAEYLFQNGLLNKKRIIYTVFEPIEVQMKITFKHNTDDTDKIDNTDTGIVDTESPTVNVKILDGNSNAVQTHNSISNNAIIKFKYSEWLQVSSITSDHYAFDYWTISNTTNTVYTDDSDGKFSESTKFTQIQTSSDQVVVLTAHWTEKSYSTYAKLWDKDGKDYKVYLYDEASDSISSSTSNKVVLNATDAEPLFYTATDSENSIQVRDDGYMSFTFLNVEWKKSIISFNFSPEHTFGSLYKDYLDNGYKALSCNGNYEFYGWAILKAGASTPETKVFFPYSSTIVDGETIIKTDNSDNKIFGDGDIWTGSETYMTLIAIYKPKPFTIVVDYDDIGGSLEQKTEAKKDEFSEKTFNSSTGNTETVNNLYNDVAIVKDYNVKIVRQMSDPNIVFNSSIKDNTGKQLLCGDDVLYEITLNETYFVTTITIYNYIIFSGGKYYENTVTMTYNRKSNTWNYNIENKGNQLVFSKGTESAYTFFGDTAVNKLKADVVGNTVSLQISNLANPNGNTENNEHEIPKEGISTLTGNKGFVIKFSANSITSDDNDVLLIDSTEFTDGINNHRADNTALQLASQPLVFENGDKTAYFWYNQKRYYLIKESSAFSKTGSVEKFYLFKSDVSGYSGEESSYDAFLNQSITSATSNVIIAYLQRIYDLNGTINFNVIYPARYSGTASKSATDGYEINDYYFTTTISYNNTRLLAIMPNQAKVYESERPSLITSSGFYELNNYVTSIRIGTTNLFTFSTPTRSLIGSGIKTFDDFNLNVSSSIASEIACAKGSWINYLGENYVVHAAYKSKVDGDYYLYFARRSSDHFTIYFLYYDKFANEVGVANPGADKITVNFSRLSYNLVINDNSDETDNFSTGTAIDSKFNIYKSSSDSAVIYSGSEVVKNKFNISNASEDSPYKFLASNNNRFAFMPANGYMISSFSLSVNGVPIFAFSLNSSTSFNNLQLAGNADDGYYYTYTIGDGTNIYSQLLYEMPQYNNNVIASDITNKENLGCYYTYRGSGKWQTSATNDNTYNFNQLFVMISGIYGNVSVDIEMISYAELLFEPETEGHNGLIESIPGSATNIVSYNLSNTNLDIFRKTSSTSSSVELISDSDVVTRLYASTHNNIKKGTYRIIFLGKANLIKYGLKIVASGEDYSYAFTNGTFYLSPTDKTDTSKTTNAFQYLDEYSGRTNDGSAISSLQKTDILVYMGLGTSVGNKFSSFFNYTSNNYFEPLRSVLKENEQNIKFFMSVKVLTNTTKVTTNTYLYNTNLEKVDSDTNTYTGTYTSGYSYKYNLEETRLSLNGSGFSDVQTYQLDNTSKSESWFNNIVLSNLDIAYDSRIINWQDDGVYNKQSFGNRFDSTGYGFTFSYNEIPGYYLEYIAVRIVEHNMLLFKVADIIKTGTLSANFSMKSFGRGAHDEEQYTITIVYETLNADALSDGSDDFQSRFVVNLYKKALPGKSASVTDNIYSVGILANDISVEFLSRPYEYRVIYNMFDFTLDGGNKSIFSSYAASSITAPASTDGEKKYYQNIQYDTLTNLTAVATMPGYTFIGWGSQYYYVYDDSVSDYVYSPRQVYNGTTHLTTWNSSSSWVTITDLFKYENRAGLFQFNTDYANKKVSNVGVFPGSAFYTSGGKFVTDTGYSIAGGSRSSTVPVENYNFWIEYINSFMKTVGNYVSYQGKKLTPEWKTNSQGVYTDVRNIELYGVWKANTYALKFEVNTLEDQSVVYLDYNNSGIFRNDVLLPNKLGFYNDSQSLYAYVTFDTNLWYVTTDPNYSYTTNAISIANGNMLDLIVDRYGYSWLGWFSKGQEEEIRQKTLKTDSINALNSMTIGATFASTYYNKMVNPENQSIVPSFNYTMYQNNNLNDSLFDTNKFTTLDRNNTTNHNIAYYDYATYDASSTGLMTVLTVSYTDNSGTTFQIKIDGNKGIIKTKDYLNISISENSDYLINGVGRINYIITYYDTALSTQSYKTDGDGNLVIDKNAGLRIFSLYAYWQTNLYNLIFDWQDDNNTSVSLNHLGSTVTEPLSISNTQGLQYHFYDQELDTFLRGLVPYREGYDFIGWSFNYIPKESTTYTEKMSSINTPTSIFYLCEDLFGNSQSLEGIVATNYSNTLYSVNNRISSWTGEYDWLLTNSGSEKLGNDWVDDDEEKHYVYIFALWTAQTFSINVSLNIEKENLENLYEIDSDFALGLYHDDLATYTGISSNNYMYNEVTFNDIVANITFEIEFDQTFKNVIDDTESIRDGAKLTFANRTFYIDDLFATSAGYYFLGLMIDNTYTDDNSYLVKNTLQTVWGEAGLTNSNHSGEIKYYAGASYNNNPVLDHDLYHELHVTNHKIIEGNPTTNLSDRNYANLADKKTSSHTTDSLYSGVDFVTEDKIVNTERTRYGSTNFGLLSFSGRNYYINSEVVETNEGTEYYLYILINGNKYYVVYYQYVSDAAGGSVDCITFDRTFLYYNDANGHKYKIHFAYNADCSKYISYYVTDNFADKVDGTNPNGRTDIKLRFALYTTKQNTVTLKSGAQSSTIDTGLLSYQYDVLNSDYQTGTIAWGGVSLRFNISSFTTRQITVYAHWQNKNLDINLINASASNVGSSTSNNGLSGYYNVQNLTDKKNEAYSNYKVKNRDDDSLVTKGISENGEKQSIWTYSINYYDSLQFLILPYFNGRYLSEMTLEFDDLREIKDTEVESVAYGSSTFAKIKRSITFKFQYNNGNRTISIALNGITSSFITPSYANPINGEVTGSYSNEAGVNYTDLSYTDYLFTQTSYLSIIDAESFACELTEDGKELKNYNSSAYGGGGLRVFEYLGLDDEGELIKMKQRTNVNAVNFELDNIMSSINISCKFSVQTYQVNLYSVANQDGDALIKTEDENEEHYYSETYPKLDDVKKDSNATAAKIPLLGAPYKSSSGYTRTNIATIKSDCSDVTSISYNVPYGYYLYGIGYNVDAKPYRPIDTELYPVDEYYGFNYLYGQGNYKFGATETSIMGPSGDRYARQCSAALGSSQLNEAKGIRLTNLASYAFSGWYELDDNVTYTPNGTEDKFVVFNEYSKADEATYIDRNMDLYGYYYDSDNSKSVTFYYWDNDAEMYMIYTENKDIYTLSNTINTSGYKVVDNVLIMDNEKQDVERVTTHKFSGQEIELSVLNIYTKFGADTEAFNDANYTGSEFMNDVNDSHVLKAVVDTYWFYYVKYDFMYIEVGEDKVKYFAKEDSLSGTDVTFCFVNGNDPTDIKYAGSKIEIDNSVGGRVYRVETTDGSYSVKLMTQVCKQGVYERDEDEIRYEYDFIGSDLYVEYSGRYYKLTEHTNNGEDNNNSRYEVEIGGRTYYLITGIGENSNASILYMYESGAFSTADIAGYKITSLKNYLVICDDKYYPIVYPQFVDTGGSLYVNPYKYIKSNKENIDFMNTLSIQVEIEEDVYSKVDLFFDYETGILYTDQEFVNKASTDTYKVYSPLNENFTMNVESGNGGYSITSVKLTKLPSSNSSEWYNDIRYGFVCYINVDDDIIQRISAEGGDGIYKTFENYIYSDTNTIFDGFEEKAMEDLKNNLIDYQDAQKFFNTFITVEKYHFDESDRKTIIKVEANLYVEFKFFYYVADGNGDLVKGEPVYVTLLCPYTFDVISDDTEINETLYAIPIFAPYVVEFTKNTATVGGDSGCEITIDASKMEVSYFEVSSEDVIVYDEKNGNYLYFAVLTENQYNDLINATTGDYASNLNLLIKGNHCPIFSKDPVLNYPTTSPLTYDLNNIDINTEVDGVYQDIYLLAFYYKEGKDYIVRVSDNSLKFNMTKESEVNKVVSSVIVKLP